MSLKHFAKKQLRSLTDHPVAGRLAAVLDLPADKLRGNEPATALLSGEALTGHPLHPAVVHFPIGGAVAAAILEVVGGGHFKAASTVVTALTVATALPSAAAGMVDWSLNRDDTRLRRLGAVHAFVAGTGTTLSLLSLLARARGRHTAAGGYVLGAAAAYGAAAFLGGDLVYGEEGLASHLER